jgi:DNA (cytosine-5)-methyltransferase 1
MNVLSLFSGIGGFELGLERAGDFRTVAQVERDPYCRQVLARHWPDVARFEDIHDFGRHSIDDAIDLVCGGPPCQPYSDAGERRGTADDRHLWPEMRRVIAEFYPTWILVENVTGFIGLFLDQALSDLEAEGYETGAIVLPAVAFDAPHRRDRVFLMAHAHSLREQQPQGAHRKERRWTGNGSTTQPVPLPHTNGPRLAHRQTPRTHATQDPQLERCGRPRWAPEPRVGRMVDGLPYRMDRVKALGNALVPQVAEHIGRLILAVEKEKIPHG